MHIDTINFNFNAGQSEISRAFIEALLRGPEPCVSPSNA